MKQKLAFLKKCKNMSTKQETVSDAAFKACPLSFDFNFVCKDGQVTSAKCKYYCPLVVNPMITNCCKELCHVAEFLGLSLKMWPCKKTSPLLCKNQSFFLLFRNVATLIKSHCVLLLLFTPWWSIFYQRLRQLLPLPFVKEYISLKSKIIFGYVYLW